MPAPAPVTRAILPASLAIDLERLNARNSHVVDMMVVTIDRFAAEAELMRPGVATVVNREALETARNIDQQR
jgi:hypothetical protein